MADKVEGVGRIFGDQFNFTLDGLATAAQMDKLIRAIDRSLGAGPGEAPGSRRDAMRRNRELQDRLNQSIAAGADAAKDRAEADRSLKDAQDDLEKSFDRFSNSLRYGGFKNVRGFLEAVDTGGARFALSVGYVVGELFDYANKLSAGLQRGIGGNIFDYAVMAKTAGVTIEQFSKAIAETGGGFASLGVGATAGARQFAGLVSEVRNATASVGNLGLSNAQMAEFTAQQTKVAVSQGFKGRAAQEQVVKNSRALAEELDVLANRTGKSVLELAQAAMKLAQDPIVSNFVQTAKQGGAEISKSVQQFAASLRGVLGELGDTLAADALKSALGGLPFSITQSGKNMIMASAAVYSEFERQAGIVRRGGEITAADQEKLRNTIIAEVEARGDELRMLANLEGPIGDSARQLLELGKQANFYNSEAGRERQAQDKRAQEFNAQIRQLQANLQGLAIPFLQLLNMVDWGQLIEALSAFTDIIRMALSPLEGLGNILGTEKLPGKVLGALVAFGTLLGIVLSVKGMYIRSIQLATLALNRFSAATAAKTGYDLRTSGFTRSARGGAGAIGAGLLGAGVAGAIMGPAESTAGTVGSIAGGLGGSALGAMAGPAIGRVLGGLVGSLGGPAGTVIGTVLGGALGTAVGQWLGDKLSTSGDTLSSIGSENIDDSQKQAKANSAALQNMDRTMTAIYEQTSVANSIAGYGNRIAADQVRATTNMGYRLG
jgi:hypothetical protein